MMGRQSNPISQTDTNWNISHWRLLREIKNAAKELGFSGDALTDNSRVGTWQQEMAIIWLASSINLQIVGPHLSFARRIIRNIVLNSGVRHESRN